MYGDLFDHTADKRLPVFDFAFLFINKSDRCLDPVGLILPKRRLRESILPAFTEGDYPFACFLYCGFIITGGKQVFPALSYVCPAHAGIGRGFFYNDP